MGKERSVVVVNDANGEMVGIVATMRGEPGSVHARAMALERSREDEAPPATPRPAGAAKATPESRRNARSRRAVRGSAAETPRRQGEGIGRTGRAGGERRGGAAGTRRGAQGAEGETRRHGARIDGIRRHRPGTLHARREIRVFGNEARRGEVRRLRQAGHRRAWRPGQAASPGLVRGRPRGPSAVGRRDERCRRRRPVVCSGARWATGRQSTGNSFRTRIRRR